MNMDGCGVGSQVRSCMMSGMITRTLRQAGQNLRSTHAVRRTAPDLRWPSRLSHAHRMDHTCGLLPRPRTTPYISRSQWGRPVALLFVRYMTTTRRSQTNCRSKLVRYFLLHCVQHCHLCSFSFTFYKWWISLFLLLFVIAVVKNLHHYIHSFSLCSKL